MDLQAQIDSQLRQNAATINNEGKEQISWEALVKHLEKLIIQFQTAK